MQTHPVAQEVSEIFGGHLATGRDLHADAPMPLARAAGSVTRGRSIGQRRPVPALGPRRPKRLAADPHFLAVLGPSHVHQHLLEGGDLNRRVSSAARPILLVAAVLNGFPNHSIYPLKA